MNSSEPSSANSAESDTPPVDRRAVAAWCLYDWANSAFPTVIITFVFAVYFTSAIAPDEETGTAWWGWTLSLSGLAIAIASPVLGAIADENGPRKPWIAAFSGICVLSGVALWTIEPNADLAIKALIIVGIANFAFEVATVFYNAMLPSLVPRRMFGLVSGWAWGCGYAGGLACLGLCLVFLVQADPPIFGLDKENAEHVRATGPFVAIWFLIFALPLFLFVPDRQRSRKPLGLTVRAGLSTLWATLKRFRALGPVPRFLIARMLYTDGLNTLFQFGGIYAAGTFGMETDEILIFALLLNVTAGLGAFGFAWIDSWFGAKPTIVISVSALLVLGFAILLIDSKLWFYILGCAIGVFIGPAQSASRSLMALMAPPGLAAEMFGLYALSGRITAFLGPFLVGTVTVLTASQRWGMATILLLFAAGLAILLPLKVTRDGTPAPQQA